MTDATIAVENLSIGDPSIVVLPHMEMLGDLPQVLDMDKRVETVLQQTLEAVTGNPDLEKETNALMRQGEIEKALLDIERALANTEYILSPELIIALQSAIDLNKPLFLTGEPGTGKTSLGTALAAQLGIPLIKVVMKSNTPVSELIHVYDYMEEFRDSNNGVVSDRSKYVRFGPIGEALTANGRVVLIIDEIDKGPRNSDGDLLEVLENNAGKYSFRVNETGQVITSTEPPIIIITSNNQRKMSDAFTRRCVYSDIPFPEKGQMSEIVRRHHPRLSEKLLTSALDRMYKIRADENLEQKPSTAELIDWVQLLMSKGIETVEVDGKIPYASVLFKRKNDLDRYRAAKETIPQTLPEHIQAALGGEKVIEVTCLNDEIALPQEDFLLLCTELVNAGFNIKPSKKGSEFNIFLPNRPEFRRIKDPQNPNRVIFTLGNDAQEDPGIRKFLDVIFDRLLLKSVFDTDSPQQAFTQISGGDAGFVAGLAEGDTELYRVGDTFVAERKTPLSAPDELTGTEFVFGTNSNGRTE